MDVYRELAERLLQVEAELRAMQLWELDSPPAEAMASTEPFALDQLRFSQWLQFVFLPRMNLIIETESPLPASCIIAPMAEGCFKAEGINGAAMVAHLAAIDGLLTQN